MTCCTPGVVPFLGVPVEHSHCLTTAGAAAACCVMCVQSACRAVVAIPAPTVLQTPSAWVVPTRSAHHAEPAWRHPLQPRALMLASVSQTHERTTSCAQRVAHPMRGGCLAFRTVAVHDVSRHMPGLYRGICLDEHVCCSTMAAPSLHGLVEPTADPVVSARVTPCHMFTIWLILSKLNYALCHNCCIHFKNCSQCMRGQHQRPQGHLPPRGRRPIHHCERHPQGVREFDLG